MLARNDPRVRLLEGLEQRVDVLHGDVPETSSCARARCEYEVDPRVGQKTGFFLDQRENREAASLYARGRVLDCFSYNGGFALRLARRWSASRRSTARPKRSHASRRMPPQRLDERDGREANVFDELRRLEKSGDRYDTIVLDPPAFAKNKASIPKALAGYKDINLRALRLLNPGGYLDHLQLLVQRRRSDFCGRRLRSVGR